MHSIILDLQAGMTAAQAENKAVARTYFLRVLANEPRNETAWLWLSSVMPSTEQAIRCIEQLLAINPAHVRALEAREMLRVRLLVEEASPGNLTGATSTAQRRYLLGEALMEARIITQEQLDRAMLRQSELSQKNKPVRLGDLLVGLQTVTRKQIDAALAAQVDSVAPEPANAEAQHFGEFLVQQGQITRAQLHQGLTQQAEDKSSDRSTLLGEILVRCGYLERSVLHQMLIAWHHQLIVQQAAKAKTIK